MLKWLSKKLIKVDSSKLDSSKEDSKKSDKKKRGNSKAIFQSKSKNSSSRNRRNSRSPKETPTPWVAKGKKHPQAEAFRKKIDHDAMKIIKTLQENGFESYIVGGCVRDLILGQSPKDFDIASSASPHKVKNLISRSFIIGKRFRIVVAKRRPELEEMESNLLFPPLLRSGKIAEKEIQITTFRREPEMQGDKLNENVFGSAKDDAFRRDFTVNGLFYDPISGVIVDHVGGLQDLDDRKLRMIGDPKERFWEDPIRVLRAIRFCVRADFTLEEQTEKALKKEIHCLKEAKKERVREEVLKFLKEGTAGKGFKMIQDYNAWQFLSPTWSDYLEKHPEHKDFFIKSCGQFSAENWHPSFGVTPLLYIFLLPLTLLDHSQSKLINSVLRGVADELKISKVEKEEIQFLHKTVNGLLKDPTKSYPFQKRSSNIVRQIQVFLTIKFLSEIDSDKWGALWEKHKSEWEEHLDWVRETLKNEHATQDKRPPRRKSKRKHRGRGKKGPTNSPKKSS